MNLVTSMTLFLKGSTMEVKQVVEAGKLTSSYLSSYNNSLQLTVEGGHEINVRLPEGELRDLANRLNERLESIDAEKQEELEAKVRAELEAQEEELAGLDNEETND